jgi:hypothetical protein
MLTDGAAKATPLVCDDGAAPNPEGAAGAEGNPAGWPNPAIVAGG